METDENKSEIYQVRKKKNGKVAYLIDVDSIKQPIFVFPKYTDT